MILSVSRRTDIPNYYSEWFLNRIKEGFVYVRNPMNYHQVSRIELSSENIDCIVFWTKNPEPMLDKLEILEDYSYYFQVTLTGYGRDIEPGVPHKKEKMIPVVRRLSEEIGYRKVVWRYDPIFISDKYTVKYHIHAFHEIAGQLEGHTDCCVISFFDVYNCNKRQIQRLGIREPDENEIEQLAAAFAKEAYSRRIEVVTCAEKADLSAYGILHGSCIDVHRINALTGMNLKPGKDRNQREGCGCMTSVDIGSYNTCLNGCAYCYANHNQTAIDTNSSVYDRNSPLLCSSITAADRITQRGNPREIVDYLVG